MGYFAGARNERLLFYLIHRGVLTSSTGRSTLERTRTRVSDGGTLGATV